MLSIRETMLMGLELAKAYRRQYMTKAAIREFQARKLSSLIKFAQTNSPFYRDRFAGLENEPLSSYPVTTKQDLTNNFDRAVTDPSLTLTRAEAYLDNLTGEDTLLDGKYRICSTSGSTGARGILPLNQQEWATFMAGIARTAKWAGVPTPVFRPRRVAALASSKPGAMSARSSDAMPDFLAKKLRIDPIERLDDIVAKLNEFQPETLGGFTSVQRILAEEQLSGRLKIRPTSILATSEPLTPETRRIIKQAFGIEPFNNYIAAEANLASDCAMHNLHIFEDWVILESVDDENRPVPAGEFGHKVLLTVLWSRTLPLIRYELTDSIALAREPCPCGLPFAVISSVDGRQADIMHMASKNGGIAVIHPIVLVSGGMDKVRSLGWRIIQTEEGLDLIVAKPDPNFDVATVTAELHRALDQHDAAPRKINVTIIDEIPRTSGSKAPMIQALPKRQLS